MLNLIAYAVICFDLSGTNITVYDGLQFDTKTWQAHIDGIWTMLGNKIVDSGQWNVTVKTYSG